MSNLLLKYKIIQILLLSSIPVQCMEPRSEVRANYPYYLGIVEQPYRWFGDGKILRSISELCHKLNEKSSKTDLEELTVFENDMAKKKIKMKYFKEFSNEENPKDFFRTQNWSFGHFWYRSYIVDKFNPNLKIDSRESFSVSQIVTNKGMIAKKEKLDQQLNALLIMKNLVHNYLFVGNTFHNPGLSEEPYPTSNPIQNLLWHLTLDTQCKIAEEIPQQFEFGDPFVGEKTRSVVTKTKGGTLDLATIVALDYDEKSQSFKTFFFPQRFKLFYILLSIVKLVNKYFYHCNISPESIVLIEYNEQRDFALKDFRVKFKGKFYRPQIRKLNFAVFRENRLTHFPKNILNELEKFFEISNNKYRNQEYCLSNQNYYQGFLQRSNNKDKEADVISLILSFIHFEFGLDKSVIPFKKMIFTSHISILEQIKNNGNMSWKKLLIFSTKFLFEQEDSLKDLSLNRFDDLISKQISMTQKEGRNSGLIDSTEYSIPVIIEKSNYLEGMKTVYNLMNTFLNVIFKSKLERDYREIIEKEIRNRRIIQNKNTGFSWAPKKEEDLILKALKEKENGENDYKALYHDYVDILIGFAFPEGGRKIYPDSKEKHRNKQNNMNFFEKRNTTFKKSEFNYFEIEKYENKRLKMILKELLKLNNDLENVLGFSILGEKLRQKKDSEKKNLGKNLKISKNKNIERKKRIIKKIRKLFNNKLWKNNSNESQILKLNQNNLI